MAAIRLSGVSKQFGPREILREVTLELHPGEIVGLVGPNGAGKTTLFRLIAGHIPPDTGTVTRSRDLLVGYLEQEPRVDPSATLHDEVLSAFAEVLALEQRMHQLSEQISRTAAGACQDDLLQQYDGLQARFESAGGYAYEQRLREILGGLGFSESDRHLPVSVLSGGQKCRAALAKLLLNDNEYLLLDEPTNHLDLDAVRWLERFLAGHHGGAAIISHDRYLLDRVASRIVLLENLRVKSYSGNYSTFAETRETERLTQQRQFEKDAAFIAKERDYIARYGAGQRARQARGRKTRLERRIEQGEFVQEQVQNRRTMRLRIDAQSAAAHEVLQVEGLAKSFGEKSLIRGLSLRVTAGQRVGVIGPNGCGKSTLLRLLLGKLKPDAGRVEFARKLQIGYFAQDSGELDLQRTILDHIAADCPDCTETELRGLLGAFLFSGDDVFKPVSALSGGEQSRLRLIRLLLGSPNMLLLDEPTNHLDIASREALEAALEDYSGTLLVVSHDRYFLDRVVDRVLSLRSDGARLIEGNYTTYIETLEREAQQHAERVAAAHRTAAAAKRSRASPAADMGKPVRCSPYAKLKLEELEQRIMDREDRITALNARFGEADVYRDAGQVAALRSELAAIQQELAELEQAWSERVE